MSEEVFLPSILCLTMGTQEVHDKHMALEDDRSRGRDPCRSQSLEVPHLFLGPQLDQSTGITAAITMTETIFTWHPTT